MNSSATKHSQYKAMCRQPYFHAALFARNASEAFYQRFDSPLQLRAPDAASPGRYPLRAWLAWHWSVRRGARRSFPFLVARAPVDSMLQLLGWNFRRSSSVDYVFASLVCRVHLFEQFCQSSTPSS